MGLHPLEFVIGGTAACGACIFTNPLEVAKTRMQLQGELKAKGQYKVHYRNVFHAFYTIGKVDGLLALQKGLAPALCYQFCMNGVRLGVFETIDKYGLFRDKEARVIAWKSVIAAGFAGCVGAFVSSPFYMVKVQLQSRASELIAVGHQHHTAALSHAFSHIYSQHGIIGLWRGVGSAVPRVMVGSAAQLSSFSWVRQKLVHAEVFSSASDWRNGLVAAMMSGIVVVTFMTPFDVVTTRIYNQAVTTHGSGTFYKGGVDCFVKVFKAEGIWGFYKGWGASYFRTGPHTIISLLCWDQLKIFAKKFNIGGY